jgi:hypothetical protein
MTTSLEALQTSIQAKEDKATNDVVKEVWSAMGQLAAEVRAISDEGGTSVPGTSQQVADMQKQTDQLNAFINQQAGWLQDVKTNLQMPEVLPNGLPGTMAQLPGWALDIMTELNKRRTGKL